MNNLTSEQKEYYRMLSISKRTRKIHIFKYLGYWGFIMYYSIKDTKEVYKFVDRLNHDINFGLI